MGKPISDDDEPLELPHAPDGDDGEVGVADADELTLAEIADAPEDVGLDTDAGVGDGFEAALEDLDEEDDEAGFDEFLEVEAELDAEGEEHGWTEESEGSSEPWDDSLFEADESADDDDGGLEGVDDPLLDGIADEDSMRLPILDEDDASTEDLGDDLLGESALER